MQAGPAPVAAFRRANFLRYDFVTKHDFGTSGPAI
jgi:hypothetical protein